MYASINAADTHRKHCPIYCVRSDQYPTDYTAEKTNRALSHQPELLALQLRKDLEELLIETDELCSELVLILDVRRALREVGAHGLFGLEGRGYVRLAVLVHGRRSLAEGPRERPVLLQEALKGGAARACGP
jgi:hypothetical protein